MGLENSELDLKKVQKGIASDKVQKAFWLRVLDRMQVYFYVYSVMAGYISMYLYIYSVMAGYILAFEDFL